MSISIDSNTLKTVIPFIQNKWQNLAPGYFFRYTILEEDLNNLYRKENDIGRIFFIFSSIAIVIGCLGVLGLSTFITRQHFKEIAIRKIFGASRPQLIILFVEDYLVLIGLATAIASPIAYYFMQTWLREFAYRVQIDHFSFAWAGLITGVLTLITVSSQVIKVTRANPMEMLRYKN